MGINSLEVNCDRILYASAGPEDVLFIRDSIENQVCISHLIVPYGRQRIA